MYSDCHFFAEEGHLLDSLRIPLGVRVFLQAKNILASHIACVTNE